MARHGRSEFTMPMHPTRYAPDPKACAVARAVGEVVRPDRVILFGSRARGDFSPHSDVDLIIITGSNSTDRQKYLRTSAAAHRTVEELYGDSISVDLVRMSEGGHSITVAGRATTWQARPSATDSMRMATKSTTTTRSRPTGPTHGSAWP